MLVPHIMTECRKSGGCLIQVFLTKTADGN